MSSALQSARETVLIVDDDPDICEAVGDALSHDGYAVKACARGAQAIQAVIHQQFSAAVLDLDLPDFHGSTILKIFMEVDPSLPVIVLTGHTTVDNTIGSLKNGAFSYLTKPYNTDELKATVRRAVAVKRLSMRTVQVERALGESEQRYRSVVDAANDAIITADSLGRIVSWNAAAERMFQYSAGEIIGQSLTCLMPERYRARHEDGFRRVRETGASRVTGSVMELHGLRRDRTEFPLELSLAAWHAGTETFYSGIIRDITKRKETEEALRSSEDRLRLALRAARMGTWHWDIQTGKVIWSDGVAALFGIDPGQFPGTVAAYQDLLHPEDRSLVQHAIADALAGLRPYDIEHRTLHRDGTVRWLACKGEVIYQDGEPARMNGTVMDITERKQGEEALLETKERFRQLADNIQEVFWLSDPAKNLIIYVSPGYEKVWGRTCKSLFDSPRDWLDAIHPDDRDRVLNAALTRQASGEYDEEYRIIRPDGELRWIHDRAFPVRDSLGRVYRIAGLAEDITERKMVETALRARERRLSHVLEERERLSRDLHDGIIQSIYGIGLGLTECRRLAKQDPDACVEKLQDAVRSLNVVIRDIRGSLRGWGPRIAARELAQTLTTMAQRLNGDSHPTIIVEVAPESAEQLSDEAATQCAYIAREALSNCLQHADAHRARIELRSNGALVELVVEDDGHGFETDTRRSGGRGLNNMQVRAEQVGGTLHIRTGPGKGTAIHVRIPVTQEHSA